MGNKLVIYHSQFKDEVAQCFSFCPNAVFSPCSMKPDDQTKVRSCLLFFLKQATRLTGPEAVDHIWSAPLCKKKISV